MSFLSLLTREQWSSDCQTSRNDRHLPILIWGFPDKSHFVEMRFNKRQMLRCLYVRNDFGSPLHSLYVFSATPLDIVDHMGSIQTLVDIGRKKSRLDANGFEGFNQHIDKLLLVLRCDGENINQSDNSVSLDNLGHRSFLAFL